MPKEFSQFKGEGMKYAPKRKAKRSGSSGSAAKRRTSNTIRDANQVRQDMKRHRSQVLRMGR